MKARFLTQAKRQDQGVPPLRTDSGFKVADSLIKANTLSAHDKCSHRKMYH